MPEYLHPGVYIEEIERGPKPIEGVPTSTAAFLGEAERGPIKPRLITSYKEYQRWFGRTFGPDKFLPYAANGFFENGGKRMYLCRVVAGDATSAQAAFGNDFTVRAAGPGSWGKRVWVRVEDSTTKSPDANGNAQPVGFRLRIAYWSGNTAPFDPFIAANADRLPRPQMTEDFDDLVVDEKSPDFYGKRFPYIDLAKGNTNQGPDSAALAMLVRSANAAPGASPAKASQALAQNGADGTPLGSGDYVGLPTPQRVEYQGLSALELDPYRDVALVYAPGIVDKGIVLKITAHCENMRFRFAVVDCPKSSDVNGLDPRTKLTDTSYAAFYYPWIVISDPESGARKLVPPGGHSLGVYARTDVERGVFKAPANEILRGALDLEYDINDSTQDVLNPKGVNVIRQFPGRGIRVWGARTMSSDGLWKYVSVRRLFIFLEHSIYDGTQWVVFEPNDSRLWARVIDTIRLFLRTQWRNGALFGRTEEQAFHITCDETVMTQDDILNGRLVCEIGIAPVRPAEFVIFRIFQNTAEAQR
jgi:phage tail sheath protein FI